jgi:hypothetical protein
MQKAIIRILAATALTLVITLPAAAQPYSSEPAVSSIVAGKKMLRTTSERSYWDGQSWIRSAAVEHAFDAAGNHIQTTRSSLSDEGWQEFVSEERRYDERSHLVELTTWVFENGDNRFYQRVSYETDEAGNPVRISILGFHDVEWVEQTRYVNSFDASGRLVREAVLAKRSGSWVELSVRELTYDDVTGDSDEELHQGDGTGPLSLMWRRTTTRPQQDRREVLMASGNGTYLSRRHDSFDAAGNVIVQEHAWWNTLHNRWVNNYRYRLESAHDGEVWLYETSDGTDWMPGSRTTIRYDAAGLPESYLQHDYDRWSESWIPRTITTHTWVEHTATNIRPDDQLVLEFTLHSNYPNPFNPSTALRFEMQQAGHVSIGVFDVTGRQVAVLVNGTMPAGIHEAVFEAGNLPSGMYIARMAVGGKTTSRPMTLVK